MAKTYVTFGQVHAHSINDITLDKDCVAVINCNNASEGRSIAYRLFGTKFCFEYHEDEFDFDSLVYFPRGLIEVFP